LVDLDHF